MESILDYLRRNLRDAGPRRWSAIADEISDQLGLEGEKRFGMHALRKIVNGERPNPGLKFVQPLLDMFQAIERGERELPEANKQEA